MDPKKIVVEKATHPRLAHTVKGLAGRIDHVEGLCDAAHDRRMRIVADIFAKVDGCSERIDALTLRLDGIASRLDDALKMIADLSALRVKDADRFSAIEARLDPAAVTLRIVSDEPDAIDTPDALPVGNDTREEPKS